MMHDHEKSDSAIVAEKPTNKAVPTAAEPVEPRAGAKGNASQHSTHRTQGRERVSQALERVRQAARQRKKEKFTALLHHISIDGLRMAFFALKMPAGGDANRRPAISGAHHHYKTARLTYDPSEDRRTRRFPRSSPSERDEIG